MPDLTKTRIELINRAARKAMLIASGQELEAEDSEVIDEAIDGVLADLAERGVVYVSDADAVDIAVFEWVADILAQKTAPDFGKATDFNAIEFAEQKLRVITSAKATYEVLKAEHW